MIDEIGLVVDRDDLDVGRQRVAGAQLRERVLDPGDDGGRARAGQPGDRDRDHLAARARDDHVGVLVAVAHVGDHRQRHRADRADRDRQRAQLVEVHRLGVEHDGQGLVLVPHPARGDHLVLLLDLLRELRRGQVQRGELGRPDHELDLADPAAADLDAADALDPHDRGPDDALGDLAQPPQIGLDPGRRRDVERDHGDRGRQHALHDRRRAPGELDVIDRGLARVLRGQRIGAVGEQQRQLDRAADRAGADMADPGHDRERLLERPRHLRLDEVGRQLAGLGDDDDPRELHLGVDAARQLEDRDRPERGEPQHGDPHQAGMTPQPSHERHLLVTPFAVRALSSLPVPALPLSARLWSAATSAWPSWRPST